MNKSIKVIVGLIEQDNKFLIAKRNKEFMPDFWELPGGKVEKNETNQQTLQRECYEELSILVKECEFFCHFSYHYPDRIVDLWVYKIHHYAQQPVGYENQQIAWISLSQMQQYQLLPATLLIFKRSQLNHTYWITPKVFAIPEVEQQLKRGIRQIQWRIQADFNHNEHQSLLNQLQTLCEQYQAKLFLNAYDLQLKKTNLHLNSQLLKQLKARPISESYLLGASVHNLNELEKAQQIQADFVVLSPVLKTSSHPNAKSLGWQTTQHIIKQTNLPVYCLGGMNLTHLEYAQSIGGFGIAGISQI